MTINNFFSLLTRWRNGLVSIHKESSISLLYLWIDSIWCFIAYGCSIRQYSIGQFYRYPFFERRNILTYRKLFRLINGTNNPSFTCYLSDKELFNVRFSRFISRHWTTSKKMNERSFDHLCNTNNGLIVKPLDGMEGKGVFHIPDDDLKDINKRKALYERLSKDNVIIEECVRQHHKMVFGGNSVNTIRVMTLMNKQGEVRVLKAVLRAGVGDSVVDNFHQGGCVYEVHLQSGRICSLGMSTTCRRILFHPRTEICMLGYEIPNWCLVIDGCCEAHKLLPECRYISWDVAITEEGIELIEGNHDGDYDMFEFVGTNQYWPLLRQYL